jgi:hypothetical protein
MRNEMEETEVNCVWLRDDNRHPVTLVAYKAVDDVTLQYAFATHTPPDVFCRKHAHNKAMGRLESNDPEFVRQVKLIPELGPAASIAQHIVETQRGDTMLPPTRTCTAATHTLPVLAANYARKLAEKAGK